MTDWLTDWLVSMQVTDLTPELIMRQSEYTSQVFIESLTWHQNLSWGSLSTRVKSSLSHWPDTRTYHEAVWVHESSLHWVTDLTPELIMRQSEYTCQVFIESLTWHQNLSWGSRSTRVKSSLSHWPDTRTYHEAVWVHESSLHWVTDLTPELIMRQSEYTCQVFIESLTWHQNLSWGSLSTRVKSSLSHWPDTRTYHEAVWVHESSLHWVTHLTPELIMRQSEYMSQVFIESLTWHQNLSWGSLSTRVKSSLSHWPDTRTYHEAVWVHESSLHWVTDLTPELIMRQSEYTSQVFIESLTWHQNLSWGSLSTRVKSSLSHWPDTRTYHEAVWVHESSLHWVTDLTPELIMRQSEHTSQVFIESLTWHQNLSWGSLSTRVKSSLSHWPDTRTYHEAVWAHESSIHWVTDLTPELIMRQSEYTSQVFIESLTWHQNLSWGSLSTRVKSSLGHWPDTRTYHEAVWVHESSLPGLDIGLWQPLARGASESENPLAPPKTHWPPNNM